MTLHLTEISARVTPGRHASLLVDQAGWHLSERLVVPANITIVPCLSATSTDDSPWHVVPADDKKNARLIISQIVVDTLNGIGTSHPKVTAQRALELQSIRDGLAA